MQPAFLAVTEPAAAQPVLASFQTDWTLILIVLWSIGFLAVIARWALRWAQLRNVLRDSVDFPLYAPIDVKVAPSSLEPGLVGILRPVILLPKGLRAHKQRTSSIECRLGEAFLYPFSLARRTMSLAGGWSKRNMVQINDLKRSRFEVGNEQRPTAVRKTKLTWITARRYYPENSFFPVGDTG